MVNNWQEESIENLCEIVNGKTPLRSNSEYWINGDVPWFTIEDQRRQGKIIYKTNQFITQKALEKSGVKLVPKDSVLLCCTASVGEYAITRIPITTNQQFNSLIIKNKEKIIPDYLFQYSGMITKKLNSMMGKTTFGFVSVGMLGSIKIKFPDLATQQKIALILSNVDEEIQKTDQIIEKTEKLKQGLMQNILGFNNKENIKHLALSDIGKVSMCKRIFKSETSNTGEIPFYKIGTFGKEPDSFISQGLYENYRNKFSFPKTGDVLLSASGTIGRKVRYDGRPAYFQDSNIIWLEHDESKVLNDFLFYLYDTISWLTEGSTIKRLYNDNFLKKVVPVPSIEKQREICNVIGSLDSKLNVENKYREELTKIKAGLMNDIFNQKVEVKN